MWFVFVRLNPTLQKETQLNQGVEPVELEWGLWNCKEGNELNKFSKGEAIGIGDRLDIQMKNVESKITPKFESLERERRFML